MTMLMGSPTEGRKTPEARSREVEMISAQLQDLGFPDESLTEIRAALDDFAARGWGVTRTFRFRDLGVRVTLLLSTQARVVSHARVGR